jgi:hypothetical protein
MIIIYTSPKKKFKGKISFLFNGMIDFGQELEKI